LRLLSWDRKSGALAFRLRGNIPVRVSWTFTIPAVLPFVHEWQMRPREALAHTLIVFVLLFLSVFLHELAHMRIARGKGIGTDRIDLFLFGGLTHFRPGPGSPHAWAWIAFAGPLTNLVLGAAFATAYYLAFGSLVPFARDGMFSWLPRLSAGYLEWALWLGVSLNLILFILNILPAYNLDGGLIVRALLQPRIGADRASRIVGACGVLLSVLRFAIILPAAAAGVLLWFPPSFAPNWNALRGQAKSKPGRRPPGEAGPPERVEWRGRGGWPVRRR